MVLVAGGPAGWSADRRPPGGGRASLASSLAPLPPLQPSFTMKAAGLAAPKAKPQY